MGAADGPRRRRVSPPPPERLDLAIGWLERSLDALTAATRRSAELSGTGAAGADPAERPLPAADPVAAAPSQPSSAATTASSDAAPGTAAIPSAPAAVPPPASDTPLLDRIGRDLTALAAAGKLPAIIGRRTEMDWLVEVLCRRSKRNPVLLGAAGAGKTAIVEGLAQRIAMGQVPALLRGVRLIEVPLSSLVAGTEYRGQLEERVASLIREASRPGIVLFFDEIHLLAGAGGSQGGLAVDEALKPALSRGEIAVVGATTPEEYRATIEKDAALARRFTTIAIAELDRDATRPILRSIRDALARSRGVRVSDGALDTLLEFADRRIANRRFPDKAIDLLESAVAAAIVAGRTRVDKADAVRTTVRWTERASSTPTLERFGRDLVRQARDGNLGPIVGRDGEIDRLVEILMRRTKRNPLLLGPAGSGKTAIVEGLAIRIASGRVPGPIADVHLFEVPLLPLAAAIAREPEVLTDFLVEARHPSVIVFFDEVHLLSANAVKDVAESLKPALSRGEIACIGATTGQEYQASIETDAALARRFTTVGVEPMDETAVRTVLAAVRDSLATSRGIRVDDAALDELVALADEQIPNRAFPDKGVDVIEQSVAYALARGLDRVDVATAQAAVASMVGADLDPTARLGHLDGELRSRGIVDPAAAEGIRARLAVSLRGLDADRRRPDLIVLLAGGAVGAKAELAELLASEVFGRASARIEVDLSGLTENQSISTLLGSAPGLVGSDRPLPLADLRRTPRQVIVFAGIDQCAATIREAIAAGMVAGELSDAMGRPLPLGKAVVILTAPTVDPRVVDGAAGGPAHDAPESIATLRALVEARLGSTILRACDVVTASAASVSGDGRSAWLRQELLAPLVARFGRQGYALAFAPDFLPWLADAMDAAGEAPEAFLDRRVTPLLVASLPPQQGPVRVTVVDGKPTLVSVEATA